MASIASRSPPSPDSLWRGPWVVYLGALALTLVGYLGSLSDHGPVHAIGIMAGLIAAGAAVAWRLQNASHAFEERVQSACLVFLAGMLAEVDMHLLPVADAAGAAAEVADWGSARMVLRALWMAATAGAMLILLPSLGRRIAISLLVIFHFGGIFTAVTAIEPPGAPAPWLSLQAWTWVYRPYLSFMYLNNAYHFYSPDPGPPTLLWFHVHYGDDQARWVKIPVREESPVPLHHQRLLALTESTNVINAQPMSDAEFNQKINRRELVGRINTIPLHPLMPAHAQYREPQLYSKVMLSAYARFAARHFQHLENPEIPVTKVRIYKVTHKIITASELAQGHSPLDKPFYYPFYMGEFDSQGNLLDQDDPFLYWLIPIFAEDYDAGPNLSARARPEARVVDCLEIHACSRSPRGDAEKQEP